MSDPAFVAAAYTIVLGGLSLYVISIARRVRSARRTAAALERSRERALQGVPGEAPAPLASQPSEARR
jgi:hypothetical protein